MHILVHEPINALHNAVLPGVYKPRVKCYDVSQMSLKFERCMDSEVLKFRLLSDDYAKVNFVFQ